jgi:hypothetical protein
MLLKSLVCEPYNLEDSLTTLLMFSLTRVVNTVKFGLFKNFMFNFAEPVGGEITVTYESAILKGGPKTAMEIALDTQMKKSKFTTSSTEQPKGNRFYYTSIPRIIKHKGMSGQELTSMNLDKVSPLT